MTAAPSVPNMQARGTSRFGFSTAAEFWAAAAMPRKAHKVREMLEPIPSRRLSPLGFHAAAKTSGLNQNQPINDNTPTGMMTPHTVTEPMRPVTPGPPKFATVVSHSSPITPMQVATGPDDSHGINDARYPTAEIAIATLPIARKEN